MKISVVNMSTVATEEVHAVLRAVNRQIAQDFAPYWHIGGELRLEDTEGEMGDAEKAHASMRGDAILYVIEQTDPHSVRGYHEQHYLGVPFGAVHVDVSRALEKAQDGWSVTLSHEALELLADPHVNLLCRGPHPDPLQSGRIVFHWFEMCDAVQAESYEIDGVRVSNFVLPSYFTRAVGPRGNRDFLGRGGASLAPFGVKPGGYVGFFDPELGCDTEYMRADDEEATRRATLRAALEGTRRRDRRTMEGPLRAESSPDADAPPLSRDLQTLYTLVGDAPAAAQRAVHASVAVPSAAPPPAGLLLPEHLPMLRDLLDAHPAGVTEFLGKALRRSISLAEGHAIIDSLARDLGTPGARIVHMQSAAQRAATPPPDDFAFDIYPQADIPIDVANTRFETTADAFRYLIRGGLNAALYHAGRLKVDPMRSHTDVPSGFVYPLDRSPETQPLTVALFSDLANGYYHASYIARRIARKPYLYAAHLGDVYYAGSVEEVDSYLRAPFREVLDARTELFLLEGNHEMYACGRPWLDYVDEKRTGRPAGEQRQEGQYFRLDRDCPPQADGSRRGFQIVAADTAWYENARLRRADHVTWLRDTLTFGRARGRMNILLTSNEPYSYGSMDTTPLYADLFDMAVRDRLVDLWFWGNTHYCALFEPGEFPFVGSCIGHGGYPYERQHQGGISPAPCRWVEDGNRFGREDVRPDRGNNGFCELTLNLDASADLTYVDWMGRTRHTATVTLGAGGPRLA